MAGYATAGHDQVIAARVEFGAQYLDVGHTQLPQAAQRFTDKDMLDNAFPQGRMNEVRISFLGKIVQSALASYGRGRMQIGRASGMERVWQYGSYSGVAVSLKKKRQ